MTNSAVNPYQVMPPLTAEEYAELEESIRAHGVQVPVIVDESGVTIDGHHRAQIADRLGIPYRTDVKTGLTDDQKRALAFELNLNRRHLNRNQKRHLVAESLKADPQLSDREHARRTGVSHPTVASVRAELEQAGMVESFTTRTGADGVEQPVSKGQQPETDAEFLAPMDAETDAEFLARMDAETDAEFLARMDAETGAEFLAPMDAETERYDGTVNTTPDQFTIEDFVALDARIDESDANLRRLYRIQFELRMRALQHLPPGWLRDVREVDLMVRYQRLCVLLAFERSGAESPEEFAEMAADNGIHIDGEVLDDPVTIEDAATEWKEWVRIRPSDLQ